MHYFYLSSHDVNFFFIQVFLRFMFNKLFYFWAYP